MRVLTTRELNRTYLHRQLLATREPRRASDIVEHLVALQGQESDSPYLSLWARSAGFRIEDLTELLENREVIRSALLRGTQHLSAGVDFPWLRPTLQPALDRLSGRGGILAGLDTEKFTEIAREALADGPTTRPELARRLVERFPGTDVKALSYVVHLRLPLLHPPPAGVWRHRGRVRCVLAEDWLGRPLAAGPSPETLVMRYLAAFGPASAKDLQVWSGLTRLGGLLTEMRSRLRVYRDENGIDLYDVPHAPLDDPDSPAPVVFLPEFDNAVLGHADRARIIHPGDRAIVMPGWSIVRPTVLVDGFVSAVWALHGTTLSIAPLRPLAPADVAAVEEEAARLLAFVAPDAGAPDVRWAEVKDLAIDRSWRP
ncbi:winged helix DNA-binding domain-containing protein [Actinoplanes sp. GCM10030250]|uniref:winged helix DNA-binding domain-containing protein n=1 Tax=Actinoplanes sp. GCM10030250 TaxID=3273376 RepID=UPI0036212F1C